MYDDTVVSNVSDLFFHVVFFNIFQVILKTMACKRWSFSSKYSYSIGRVIGFKAKKDVTSGLIVELTDGYNCYNKHSFKMIPAKTIINLICDYDAGVGVPMPIDNKTGTYLCFILGFSLAPGMVIDLIHK